MLITYKDKRLTVPDFLIIGVARAGTTSIYFSLKEHCNCFLPTIKEPRFFSYRGVSSPIINPVNGQALRDIITDLDDYARLFQIPNKNKIVGEASTCYLYTSKITINNIKEIYADDTDKLKIIVILRNPIERAWSQYHLYLRDKVEPLSFEEAISSNVIRKRLQEKWPLGYDYIGFGMYSEKLLDFLATFPNMKVILYDDLEHDYKSIVESIYNYIGIDEIPKYIDVIKYNVSGIPKSTIAKFAAQFIYQPNPVKDFVKRYIPKSFRLKVRVEVGNALFDKMAIPPAIYNRVADIYENDINKTAKLIKRNLEHWIKIR